MRKIYKNFIFDIVAAAVTLTLGIVMLPPFGIGERALNVLMAIMLASYLTVYTQDKIRRSKGTTLILTMVEFAIISLIALTLVIQQFSPLKITEVCRIIGFAMWLRGIFSTLGMYIIASNAKRQRYGIVKFVLCVLLSTVGVYLIAEPVISDLVLTWIICIIFLLEALAFSALAILFAPAKRR